MNVDWLRAFSTRIGIEGRNVVVVSTLGFCAFALWLLIRTYVDHPVLSAVLLFVVVSLAIGVVSVALLVEPRPSDVTQRYLIQQVGKQFIYAGGMQSQDELVALLREAHNIEDLPPPSALVKGSAADKTAYQQLSRADAAEIARKDREHVDELLQKEVRRILSEAEIKEPPGQPLRETKPQPQLPPDVAAPDK